MDKADILEIREIFRDEIAPLTQEVKEIGETTRQMHQTIYGAGGNGMAGVLSKVKEDVDKLKTFRTQVLTIGGAIQAGLAAWMKWGR